MSTKAYVLVETAGGKSKEVLSKLRQLHGVVSADAVTGPYDLIAIIEGDSFPDIGDLVAVRIGGIKGIVRTVTCLAIQIP